MNSNGSSCVISIVANKTYICQYSASGGGGIAQAYQTIKDETIALPQRSIINFTGDGVVASDNAITLATDVTIPNGSGSWVNIPYDDGDVTNAVGCNGRYQSSGGFGTGAGANFSEWYAYKGNNPLWSGTGTASARRLRYRVNGDNSCQLSGQIIRTITPIAGSIDLFDASYMYNQTGTITFDADVLLRYPINIPNITSGSDLIKFIPCVLYISEEITPNLTNFGNVTKYASMPCMCMLFQSTSAPANSNLQFYVTGLSGIVFPAAPASGDCVLTILINATFSRFTD
jgi:hypothetical protein